MGNVIWFVFFGVWAALGWSICAALLAVTVIGLPFARQCLKLANFVLWPFGRTVVQSPTARRGSTIGNIFWLIPGVVLAIGYAVSGTLMCITVVGIPFGVQVFKLIPLAIAPFGKEIVTTSIAKTDMTAVVAARA